MSVLQVYLRVIALLGPEKWLASLLAAANLGLAGILLVEPWLFGRVIDSLVAQSRAEAWRYIGLWARFAQLGIAAGVWESLPSERLAHRLRLSSIIQFSANSLAPPLP